MKSKFYAVKAGKVPGIYHSWNDCQNQTKGFSGAIYKSFATLAEAQKFIEPTEKLDLTEKEVIEIYTDGSHQRSKDYLGIGAWCRYREIDYSLSLTVSAELLKTYDVFDTCCSNPTAEFVAFAEVLKRLENAPESIVLHFFADFIGVKSWIEGTWKAKEPYIIKIRDICLARMKRMRAKVMISHVKGHSNNYGNDRADELAGKTTECDDFVKLLELLNSV